ncbi:MAG TPA: S8 family serine peptidase [Polyangiaceae bacterium]|nr:S8 family serine peptidase [Polyangiaceae bacterium]
MSRAGRSPRVFRAATSVGLAALAVAAPLRAQVELGAFVRDDPGRLPRAFGDRLSSIVELRAGSARPRGFVHVADTAAGELGVVEVAAPGFAELARAYPEARFAWSPPLRLLLDRANEWNRVAPFRNATGLTGRGVVLGMVDTGADPKHADLRDAAGNSRIAYWLDFSRERAGLHPDLEAALGCRTDPNDEEGTPCAVYTGSEVDALVNDADPSNDPGDFGGHGTHVASLAGGTGMATAPARYAGVAPEASFIVARVARKGGAIYDGDVLKAASFVFERAEALGMPAVVNLSLGTDFGGHDGSSPIERGLEGLVGDAHPGRAIVVAAGNSAGLFRDLGTGVPDPLGVHTEVHVADGSSTVVPIVTPATSEGVTEGTIYVWITVRAGDTLGLGVERRAGTVLEPVLPGRQAIAQDGVVEVTVVNGVTSDSAIPQGSYGAAVVIDGRFPSDDVFALRLEGPASARLWVEGDAELSPERSIGPLLPRAQKEGTVNLPATSPGLIGVGATVNRTEWLDAAGEDVVMGAYGGDGVPVDSTAFFSAAGPNALGVMKPDLVAPGANVIGAMAEGTDPRDPGTVAGGLFDDFGACAERGYAPGCFVIDDAHALAGGTSMSAPLVSGAIALLLEQNPTLTQAALRALLQAGARRIAGTTGDRSQLGAGALDLERTLEALDEGMNERLPGAATELVLSESFAHPDPSWPLEALLEVRDDDDHVADGFDPARLEVTVSGAVLATPAARVAPGLFRFSVVAQAESGGTSLSIDVSFDGRTLVKKTVPIAVDHALSTTLPSARGGCSLVRDERLTISGAAFVALVALACAARRRRENARVR